MYKSNISSIPYIPAILTRLKIDTCSMLTLLIPAIFVSLSLQGLSRKSSICSCIRSADPYYWLLLTYIHQGKNQGELINLLINLSILHIFLFFTGIFKSYIKPSWTEKDDIFAKTIIIMVRKEPQKCKIIIYCEDCFVPSGNLTLYHMQRTAITLVPSSPFDLMSKQIIFSNILFRTWGQKASIWNETKNTLDEITKMHR